MNKHDLFGSSYINNAASDVWGLVLDGGTADEPRFALEILKDRMGITQKGDRFELDGNLEDLSFSFSTFNMDTSTELLTGSAKDQALRALRKRTAATAMSIGDVQVTTGLKAKTVERVIAQLYADRANTHVERVLAPPDKQKGRRGYLYFCEG